MSESGDNEGFDLAEFIDDKSSLFVTMGVFGALALYISETSPAELTEASAMIRVGFAASFLIAMLIFVLIYRDMRDEFGSWHDLMHAHTRFWENPALTSFTFLAILLGMSVSFILARHQPVILMIGFVAVSLLGYVIGMNALYWAGKRVPRTPVWRIGTVITGSFAVLMVTVYLRSNVLNAFQLTPINELTVSEPVPILIDIMLLLVASLQSLAAIGVLVGLLGIPLVVIDKIRGVSPYDEPA